MMRVFIDTNVLVDFICEREGYVENAKKIFLMAYKKEIELIISSLSYINAFYIGKRYKFPSNQLVNSLQTISRFTRISGLGERTIKQALTSEWDDIEDAAQYYSAKTAGVNYIVTRNPKDFLLVHVPILTPEDFILSFQTDKLV
jgi:predicted nucleic acid-binding protein